MTTEQAQTVAEIRGILNGGDYPKAYYREAIEKALQIIDSQAAEIERLTKERDELQEEIAEMCPWPRG
jgi:hypothetical protein